MNCLPSLLCSIAIHCLMLRSVRSLQQQMNGPNRLVIHRCSKEQSIHPPLVVIVGTAQTAESWSFHIPALSKGRSVLLYEPLGLGPIFDETITPDVSLEAQAKRLRQVADDVLGDHDEIDLAGFSLGGRIAMAVAADTTRTFEVRKMHLTGVALQRSQEGLLELDKWRTLLRSSNLPDFAEAAIRISYSQVPSSNMEKWVEAVCQNHTAKGLLALLEQAHDEAGPYSVPSLADCIKCRSGRLVVGKQDRIAPPKYTNTLAERLGWPDPTLVDGAHAIPLEAPRAWRNDILAFLDEDQ